MEKPNEECMPSLYKPLESKKKSKYRPFKDKKELFNCIIIAAITHPPMRVVRTKQNGKELDDFPLYVIVSVLDKNGLCVKMCRLEYKEKTHRYLSCKNDSIEVTAQELFDDFCICGEFVCGVPKRMVW